MEDRAAVWTLIGVVVAFKAWAVFLILLMEPTREAVGLMLAMHWPFLLLPLALCVAPAAYWFRILRVRARRRRLQWEEWHVQDEAKVAEGRPHLESEGR